MYISYLKTDDGEGRLVKSVKTLDYSHKCERPFVMPLRHHLLWKTARYLDLYGEIPDGETHLRNTIERNGTQSGEALVLDAQLEQVAVECGRCHVCANRRKRRWERSAIGFFETTDLTLFGTWTFSNSYFAERWNNRSDEDFEAKLENLDGLPGFDAEAMTFERSFDERVEEYDSNNADHVSFTKALLCDERQKLMKRLRKAIDNDARFDGIKLVAHLALYEYGDLRERIHMHFMMHFDVGDRNPSYTYTFLRHWLKDNWHGRDIGFTDIKRADKARGDGGASYLFAYLLKYQEVEDKKKVVKSRSRLATSMAYRAEGTERYFAGRSASPIPPQGGDPASSSGGGFPEPVGPGEDAEDLEPKLSADSLELTDADVPLVLKRTARTIAQARSAFTDGELWSGFDDGLALPETLWREFPPDHWEWSGWLLSHFWKEKYKLFVPDVALGIAQGEVGGQGEVAVQVEAIMPRAASPSNPPVDSWRAEWFDPVTGEIYEEGSHEK